MTTKERAVERKANHLEEQKILVAGHPYLGRHTLLLLPRKGTRKDGQMEEERESPLGMKASHFAWLSIHEKLELGFSTIHVSVDWKGSWVPSLAAHLRTALALSQQ